MLFALFPAALLQAPAPPVSPLPDGITQRPALPALAAKAPGHPGYGIHLTTPLGQFIWTNLRFNDSYALANLYRVKGPAGMGPYQFGAYLLTFPGDVSPKYLIKNPVAGGPADKAGLDKDWQVLKVDGKDFEWNTLSMNAYLSLRPEVDVLARKVAGWGKGKEKVFHVVLQRSMTPPDPLDGTLEAENPDAFKPLFQGNQLWSELLKARSALPRFAPLAVTLEGHPIWVVRGVPNPYPDKGEDGSRSLLEIWNADPASASRIRPSLLVPIPSDGRLTGRVLKFKDRWVVVREAAIDPSNERLVKLEIQPWKAEVPPLLNGGRVSRELGPGAGLADQEALELAGNEALVEWKTRTLPGQLNAQNLDGAEDLVIRLEKGVLALDLEVKGARARLDAAIRAETEHRAQAELAAKQGRPAPPTPLSASESERLIDLLDQRKAILMAILGSAKQALATLRR